jgi:hypothetical protein
LKERLHVEVRMALEYLMDSRMRLPIQLELLPNIEWSINNLIIFPNIYDAVVRKVDVVDIGCIT